MARELVGHYPLEYHGFYGATPGKALKRLAKFLVEREKGKSLPPDIVSVNVTFTGDAGGTEDQDFEAYLVLGTA